MEWRLALKRALDLSDDQDRLKTLIRDIKRAKDLKEEATAKFKSGQLQPAIDGFRECLAIEEYNTSFNSQCHLNIALGTNSLYSELIV